MKHADKWKPGKFVLRNGRLTSSTDARDVPVGSRLATHIVACLYWEHIPAHVSGRLLDLGCGKAPLFASYRPYIADNVCADWQESLHGNRHLDLVCDLGKPLPFKNETFDTILLSSVLEHVALPGLLWREMARVLRQGGKILLNVPFYYCIHEAPYDYHRFTRFALEQYARKAGLELLLLEPTGGVPEIFADLLAKNLSLLPKVGGLLAAAVQRIAILFMKISAGRKVSTKSRETFPFGYFLIARKKREALSYGFKNDAS